MSREPKIGISTAAETAWYEQELPPETAPASRPAGVKRIAIIGAIVMVLIGGALAVAARRSTPRKAIAPSAAIAAPAIGDEGGGPANAAPAEAAAPVEKAAQVENAAAVAPIAPVAAAAAVAPTAPVAKASEAARPAKAAKPVRASTSRTSKATRAPRSRKPSTAPAADARPRRSGGHF